MLKTWPLPCTVGLVCVCGGGNHLNIYHDPAIGYSISQVRRCWRVGVGQWLQTHFTLTTCVGTCMRLITMEMSIDVK